MKRLSTLRADRRPAGPRGHRFRRQQAETFSISPDNRRITFDGKPAIVAAEIKKGEETLILRDKSGFPVWSGWRRR